MLEKLKELHKNSYSPYFNYPTSSIVVTNDGKEFSGVNVENANGTSICAERNAIASAVCAGYKKGDFKELNLLLPNGHLGTPCFACRQVIIEFFSKSSIVRCFSTDGNFVEYTVSELCPHPFESDDLK